MTDPWLVMQRLVAVLTAAAHGDSDTVAELVGGCDTDMLTGLVVMAAGMLCAEIANSCTVTGLDVDGYLQLLGLCTAEHTG